MKRKINTKTLSFNIWLCMIGLVIGIISVVFILSYYITLKTAQNSTIQSTTQLVTEVRNQLGYYMEYMGNISDFILTDTDIRTYMSDTSRDADKMNLAKDKITTIASVRSDISNVIIFKADGTPLTSKDYIKLNENVDYKTAPWYTKAVLARGKPVISSSHVQTIIRDDYRWVISFSRAIYSEDGNLEGVLLIDLKYNVISQLCEHIQLGKNGYIFILDGSGDIVYHPYQQLVYSNLKKEPITQIFSTKEQVFTNSETSKNYTVSNLDEAKWKIIGTYDVSDLLGDKSAVTLLYFYVFIIFLGVAIFLAIMLSNRLTVPIKRLVRGIHRIENNDFTGEVNITTKDEIGQLAHVFNNMIQRLEIQRQRNRKNLEEKRKSEIRALQAQINPHFLYNTLDSIVWMAEMGDSDAVIDMTMALSTLFRTSISKSDEFVPLSMEIEHVKSYLTIQKMRYKDKLNFKIDVPQQLMQYKVIKLFLQPIVENAIYHGIKEKDGEGYINVLGYDVGKCLIISVEDDGVGMNEETLERMLLPKEKQSGGIGVVNVNERIKLYYGTEYGLKYTSELGRGTTVVVSLPKEEF